jgi:hypothetical protein
VVLQAANATLAKLEGKANTTLDLIEPVGNKTLSGDNSTVIPALATNETLSNGTVDPALTINQTLSNSLLSSIGTYVTRYHAIH